MTEVLRPKGMSAGGDGKAERGPSSAQVRDTLRAGFEQLGLSTNESRVLVALLQVGSATASQLARLADVPRTGVYPVLDELTIKGLVHSLPGKAALWSTPGRAEVLSRLYAAQEERHQALQATMETAREMLDQLIPEDDASAAVPYVSLIPGVTKVKATVEQLFDGADSEAVMFNRPPYSWSPKTVSPYVLEALRRGVATRVLYQAAQLYSPGAEKFRRAHETYHQAGVQARVVDKLPIKLLIVDRRCALVTLPDPIDEEGFPTSQLVEHPGYTGVLMTAFENYWEQGRPYVPLDDESDAPAGPGSVPEASDRPSGPPPIGPTKQG